MYLLSHLASGRHLKTCILQLKSYQWEHKTLEMLHDILYVIALGCGQSKIVIYILSVWTCPDQKHISFYFSTGNVSLGPSKIILQEH